MATDLRFAFRYLGRRPLATATIVVVLALGIGVNSAVFSVIQAFTTRPAPSVPKDDRHVRLYGVERLTPDGRWQARALSRVELGELAARVETFSDVAAWVAEDVVLDAGEGPRNTRAQFVTPNYFTTLGVPMALGQGLRAARGADEADMDAVISHELWDEVFGRSPTVIGREVRINRVDVRIVGVTPPRFQGALPNRLPPSLWLTVSARTAIMNSAPTWLTSADSGLLTGFGRLAPRVTPEQATAIARSVASRTMLRRTPVSEVVWSAEVFPLRGRPSTASEDGLIVFGAMGTVALLILLVACTNVSSLLVASAAARRHEIAVRLSLGASRARVVRQLLTESVVLAVFGGMAGLLLYWWSTRLLATRITHVELSPDVGTVGFTLLFAIGTGVVFGLSPALHAVRSGIAAAMRDAGRTSTRRPGLQRAFVIAQIAFTQPLLVALAAVLAGAITDENTFPEESVGSRVVSLQFRVTGSASAVARRHDRIRSLAERIRREPGVETVVPDVGGSVSRNISVLAEDRGNGPRSAETIRTVVEGVAPGYFAMLDIPLLLGRDVSLADTAASEVAIVMPSDMARSFWGAGDPIGRRLTSVDWRSGTAETRRLIVVGVFDASKATTRGPGNVYTADSSRWREDALLVRTRGAASAAVSRIRALAREQVPELPIVALETLSDTRRDMRRDALWTTGGIVTAGALGLLLASIGLYALLAFAVQQRRREIGVRIALGSRPGRVAGMFLVSGVRSAVVGLLVGLPLSMAGLKLVSFGFVGVTIDLRLIGVGIAAVVLVVASLAAWLPARRAAGVDPVIALRVE